VNVGPTIFNSLRSQITSSQKTTRQNKNLSMMEKPKPKPKSKSKSKPKPPKVEALTGLPLVGPGRSKNLVGKEALRRGSASLPPPDLTVG
jgi:hypothetical protein